VFVSGIVQGVFFRQETYERATKLGLAGWVRNNPDGRVEAVFEGPEDDVRQMVEWCRAGTPLSDVDNVETQDEEPEGLSGFRVR
jgi:acylphosphatase